MQQYFAQRMGQRKRAQVGNGSAASSPGVSSNAPSSPASTEDSTNNSDMKQSKKKIKKRKRENQDDTEENVDGGALTSVREKSIEEPKQSKKKQKKRKLEGEESCVTAVMNGEEEAPIPEKRKKTSPGDHIETADGHQENDNVDISAKNKKKKKRTPEEQTE